MSDPTNRPGEPAEEPRDVDGVVGSANESLAEADAAGRDAVGEPTPAEPSTTDAEPVVAEHEPAVVEQEPVVVEQEPVVVEQEPVTGSAAADADATTAYDTTTADAGDTTMHDAPTTAYDEYTRSADSPVVTSSEPVETTGAAAGAAAVSPQPIFVQAPEPPRARGNRAAAGAIGLLAALAFAVLYLAAWLGFGALAGDVTIENVGETALEALGTWAMWVPVVVFFIAFWLLGAIINRGRWGAWVIWGILVGFAAYGGHLLGQLFQAPFWMLTATEGAQLVEGQLLAPLAIAAFVFGRELTIWFGAWAAARGKRVTELNDAAMYEYERTLEAGPTIVRQ
ncbi:ABC transporter [Microbacterium sp.]|uniref:ABC transporter n=1 Tax=Microbacterium sp. TaxID=51671 RepID=UPI002D77366D|nr:ABC transporter [Microbacterium sp.]HET6302958.1 ABC transporter [Microbacterium sp.]